MPYFPTEQESAYFCPNCQAWYTRARMNCLVNHLPGTCCHEYERRVDHARHCVYNADVTRAWALAQGTEAMKIHVSGANEPYAFGFSGFNESDRQKLVPDVPMSDIEAAIEKDGKFEHPTKPIRIMRTKDF